MNSQGKKQKTHFSHYAFSLFFENYPHSVIEVNPDGFILNANPASSKIFKTEPAELKKHSLFDYFLAEEKEKINSFLQKQSGDIKAKLKINNQLVIPIEITSNKINNPELKTMLVHFNIPDQGEKIDYGYVEKYSLKGKTVLPEVENQIIKLRTLNENLQHELNCLRTELIQKKKSEKKMLIKSITYKRTL